jgi:polysaccharide biosynthesis/export protein
MPRTRRDRILTVLTVLLGVAISGFGCQSSRSTLAKSSPTGAPSHTAYASGVVQPNATAGVLSQRSRVAWSITSGQKEPRQTLKGEDTIAADGTLALGPFGAVPIAGQNVEQARKTIERHVAHYVAEPKVTLRAVPQSTTTAAASPVESGGSTGNDAWRPAPTAVVGASYESVLPALTPPASIGPMQSTHRAQAGDGKTDPAPTEEAPQPTPLASPDTVRLHPQPAGNVHPAMHARTPVRPHDPIVPADAPHELAKVILPAYVIEPPDILLVEAKPEAMLDQPITGQHLVRPDGTISLGYKGSVTVAGMTLDQARDAVYQHLKEKGVDVKPDKVNVDVIAYNSKVYYIVTDSAGYGDQVFRMPVTGNDTVLDAIGQIYGLPPVSSKKQIWVARRTPGDAGAMQILPVDWISITERGSTASNYQLMPGDRLYVHSDKWLRLNGFIDKRIGPIERLFGATLLGSQTVNSISGRNSGTGNSVP